MVRSTRGMRWLCWTGECMSTEREREREREHGLYVVFGALVAAEATGTSCNLLSVVAVCNNCCARHGLSRVCRQHHHLTVVVLVFGAVDVVCR